MCQFGEQKARRVFVSLDAANVTAIFEYRARVMRSVPLPMRGAVRSVMGVALQEIVNCVEAQSDVRMIRGWIIFLLLLRMLLFLPPGVGRCPGNTLGHA